MPLTPSSGKSATVAERIAALESRVSHLYEEVPFGSHSVGEDGTYTDINALELGWLGLTRSELIGIRKPTEFLSQSSQDAFHKRWQSFGAHGFADLELELLRRDGSVRPISLSSNGSACTDGRFRPNRTVSFDMTESRAGSLRQQIAAMAFESVSGICITGSDGVILQVNRAFKTLTGYSAEEAKGSTMRMLSSGHHDAAFFQAMWASLKSRGSWQGEIYNRRKDGQIFIEWLSITSITGPDGAVSNYVGTFFDITASKASQAEISHLAYFDALTELPNRRMLIDRIGQALAHALRSGKRGAVLFVDLDNFKLINDTRGHAAGDLLLIEIAQRLRQSVREEDSVGRLGGDEFVVLLENLSSNDVEAANQSKRVAANVLQALALAYKISGYEFRCTASIGISMFGITDSASDLLQHSDLAMYQAKKAGRNSLRFFDPTMQVAVTARVELEQKLRRALQLNQFELYYQPQVSPHRKIVGAEALLRWHCGDEGLVSPAEFIPLAEETGLILPISQWVLQTACAQLKQWERSAHSCHLQLAINVSARQFLQIDFVMQVQDAITASAIQPENIKLELTESVVRDVEDAIGKMLALRALGVRFSMDDFGTGYSSLSNLTRLPLQQLKIDQSLVQHIGERNSDDVIVRTIVGMAHNLGLEVVAEGVETDAQEAFLESNGCALLQGYLFGKPLPLAWFEALLIASATAPV
jgi:diguanylate cyclase (GGDEF)-like protein/PAS domain S-box-containing protein